MMKLIALLLSALALASAAEQRQTVGQVVGPTPRGPKLAGLVVDDAETAARIEASVAVAKAVDVTKEKLVCVLQGVVVRVMEESIGVQVEEKRVAWCESC